VPQLSLEQFDGVAFDAEGTLLDSIPAHHDARCLAFANLGYEIDQEHQANATQYGSTPLAIIGTIMHRAGLIKTTDFANEPSVADAVALKETYYSQLARAGFKEMPEASSFFAAIATRRPGKTAIVTAAPQKYVTPFLDSYDIGHHLDSEHLISADTIQVLGLQPKPASDGYQLAKNRLQAHNLLVFEDSPPGVAAAKKAGATVIALSFDKASRVAFATDRLAYPPDYVVESYQEARELLNIA
jgi:beta-phosphoglucomutase-like phosphatase (HAD superfamily)